MRMFDAIAASAGLLCCAVVYSAGHRGLDDAQVAVVAEEARVLEHDVAQGVIWASSAMDRCYVRAETLQSPDATPIERHRMQMIAANTCADNLMDAAYD